MSRRGNSEGKRYQDSYYSGKPLLKTLYKDRTNNSTVDQRWEKLNQDKAKDMSMEFKNTSNSQYYGSDNAEEDSFRRTQGKLYNANFNHHDPNLCVCEDCLCGRHLCKLHAIAPDMSKGTVYRQSFRKRGGVPNLVVKAEDAPKNMGPHLDLSSIQKKDFSGRKGDDTSRPKPEDLLKTGGPSPHLTTYSSGFPGFKGSNQYVKPTDNMVRGNFPLQANTTYGKSFRGGGKPASLEKTPDARMFGPWMGSTSYSNTFKAPNPEDYANKYKNPEKLNKEPGYNHQYGMFLI